METKEKKPVFKKWWFWVIIAVLLIGIISAAGGSKNKTDVSSGENISQGTSDTAEKNKTTEKASESKTSYEVGEGEIRIWKSSIGTTWISAALPVKNTGSDTLYLSNGTLDIEDASGALVTTLQMVSVYPNVLQPGETAYYYEEKTLDESVEQDGLKIVPHIDVDKAKVDCVRYELSEVAVKDESYGGVKVTGRVENTSDEANSFVYIVANLFDENGILLAQQFTILNDELKPGEKIGFETTNLGYTDFKAADVASYEIYAFPNQMQF